MSDEIFQELGKWLSVIGGLGLFGLILILIIKKEPSVRDIFEFLFHFFFPNNNLPKPPPSPGIARGVFILTPFFLVMILVSLLIQIPNLTIPVKIAGDNPRKFPTDTLDVPSQTYTPTEIYIDTPTIVLSLAGSPTLSPTSTASETPTVTVTPTAIKKCKINGPINWEIMYAGNSKHSIGLNCDTLNQAGITQDNDSIIISSSTDSITRYFLASIIDPKILPYEYRFEIIPNDFRIHNCTSDVCDIDFFFGVGNRSPFEENNNDEYIGVHIRKIDSVELPKACLVNSIFNFCDNYLGDAEINMMEKMEIHIYIDNESVVFERFVNDEKFGEETVLFHQTPSMLIWGYSIRGGGSVCLEFRDITSK